tara:strand:+ start:46 stop:735 length:690 start_codon:yes stop_codon:yes gene_type:complete
MKLQKLILDKLDEESLYILGEKYPSLKTDLELKKRLESCDFQIYLPVLDFLSLNNGPKSLNIRQGLYNMRHCFPWKIGIIYDFRSGQINSIDVRIGEDFGRYRLNGKRLLFNWLDMNENKKMLRETVSNNANTSLFSTSLSLEDSMQVRDLILNNTKLSLKIKVENKNIISLKREQPLGEDFVVSLESIHSSRNSVELSRDRGGMSQIFEDIPISFSPEIKTYLSVISN